MTPSKPSQSEPISSLPTTKPKSHVRITHACDRCRSMRTKCSGEPRCSKCVKDDAECYYGDRKRERNKKDLAESVDRVQTLEGEIRSLVRQNSGIKRKFDAMQRDQETLSRLLDGLRESSDAKVLQIMSLIRSNASIEEVKSCIEDELAAMSRSGHEPSPDFSGLEDQIRHESQVERSRSGLPIHMLVDQPLHRLSASQWTNTTNDDALVSNLVSVWLTWDKMWYNWLDEVPFLREMQEGRQDSIYCSRFLVNCLLAWACPYSDYPEARSRLGGTSSMMESFIAEAKSLLETELARGPSLHLVQGLLFLFLAISLSGQDRLGYQYMLQAMEMSQEISRPQFELSVQASLETEAATAREELSEAIDLTCWGVYNTVTATCLAMTRPQLMDSPHRRKPIPHGVDAQKDDPWTPYPRPGKVTPSYRGLLTEVLCEVSLVAAKLNHVMFDVHDEQPAAQKQVEVLLLAEELSSAMVALPDTLKPRATSSVAVLTHHSFFQVIVLRIYLFLRSSVKDASPTLQQRAKSSCIKAALEVARLCNLYVAAYGSSIMPNVWTQSISMSLYTLVEEVAASEDASRLYRTQILDLCICLRAMSRRWPMSMAILRMVQLDARAKGAALPTETEKLFEEFENREWKTREMRPLISMYPDPVGATSKSGNTGSGDMGRFLKQMDSLDLEDSEKA